MLVYVNGHFVPKETASISVFDHGFLYGDGIYETLRAYNGKLFLISKHLGRLKHSADAISLKLPLSLDKIGEALTASGFAKYALLDNSAALQLARFLQADAYVVGDIASKPTPKVDLHMMDLHGRSGLSGWVHAVGKAGMTGKDFARVAADSINGPLKAAS